MGDYKSLCAAVTICATLINIHVDQLIWTAQVAQLSIVTESWNLCTGCP